MDPAGIAKALANMKEETGAKPIEIHDAAPSPSPTSSSLPSTGTPPSIGIPSTGTPPGGRGVDELFEDDVAPETPSTVPEPNQPPALPRRPALEITD
jgi:hypothetical protein